MAFRSTNSSVRGSLTRPPKTRCSLLMGWGLAQAWPATEPAPSMFLADRADRRFRGRARGRAGGIEHGTGRVGRTVAGEPRFGQLRHARLARCLESILGSAGDALADRSEQLLLLFRPRDEGCCDRADRESAGECQQRRLRHALDGL